jgi:hypothetical protein
LSIALAVLLVVGACSDGDGSASSSTTVAPDNAARVACEAWHEVLARLGDEEFMASGEFLAKLDAIALHALPSSVPGLALVTAEMARRARLPATTGDAAGYEEAVLEVEAACERAGLGLEDGGER